MSEKFEAFKTALEALCIEHGVRLKDAYNDWGHESETFVSLEEAAEDVPAGLDLEIRCVTPLTAKEKAEAAERRAKWEADAAKREEAYQKQQAEWRARMDMEQAERLQSPEYLRLSTIIAAQAEEQRKKNMRVTRIPGDANDIGERPCRVYCNEVEIEGWTVADDFRRVVETPGKVHHGAVRIDLRADGEAESAVEPARQPSGFHDMFVWTPDPEPKADVPAAEPAPAPSFAAQTVKVTAKARPKTPARKRKAGK